MDTNLRIEIVFLSGRGEYDMGVRVKRVVIDSSGSKYGYEKGLLLCMSKDGYYINYFGGIGGAETLVDDIKTKEEAKEKFLELVWEMS